MPLTTDMTTISVVVAMTTPSNVRKDRSLWLRSASSAIQKASRAVTQMVAPRARRGGCGMAVTVPPRCLCASCLPCLSLHEVITPRSEYATAGGSVPRRPIERILAESTRQSRDRKGALDIEVGDKRSPAPRAPRRGSDYVARQGRFAARPCGDLY